MSKKRKSPRAQNPPPKKPEDTPKPSGPKVKSEEYRGGWRGSFAGILALAGMGISLYLSYSHIALLLGEVHGGALCGSGGGLGCHGVSMSRYGTLVGIPLSIWGVFFYSVIAVLAIGGIILRRDQGRAFHVFAFHLTGLAIAFDLYLLYVMIVRLEVVCPLCVSTYVVNLLLCIVLFGAVRGKGKPSPSVRSMFPRLRAPEGPSPVAYYENAVKGLILGAVALSFLVVCGGSRALSHIMMSSDAGMVENILEKLSRQQPRVISTEGRPALGSEDAPVTIIEYSDFRCAFCRKAAKYIKIAAAADRTKARFVFRHMPLDKACNDRLRKNLHPGACKLAEGAVCAHEQGKFWEYHDLAFESEGRVTPALLNTLADQAGLDVDEFRGCLDSGWGEEIVREDIREGRAARATSTPTLFVNGRILKGAYKPSVLEQIIQHVLEMPADEETDPDPSSKTTLPLPIDIHISNPPVQGTPAVPITAVEFGDFRCPFCANS